jgi:hypothetical protein
MSLPRRERAGRRRRYIPALRGGRVGFAAWRLRSRRRFPPVAPDSTRAPKSLRRALGAAKSGCTVSFRKLILALLVALPLLVAAGSTSADEPVRPVRRDPGAYPPPSAQPGLFFVGLGATAAWYGAALGFSYLWPDAPGANDLRIPVAGPWMALADTGCADTDPNCSIFIVVLRAILTTMDAVGQAGGVAVMAEALFLPTQEVAPAPPRRRPRLQRETGAKLLPAPMLAGQDGVGLGIVGSF